jgi:hypothetical protein
MIYIYVYIYIDMYPMFAACVESLGQFGVVKKKYYPVPESDTSTEYVPYFTVQYPYL